jgi:hypothetical protein
MRTFQQKMFAIASACALTLAGCTGGTGPAGPIGPTGPGGGSTGTIAGTLTYNPGTGAIPAPSVSVNVLPDVGLTAAVSAADGTYELANVPVGVYTVAFSGSGYASDQATNVSVIATRTTTVSKLLVATNPIVLAAVAARAPAGFGKPATLAVTVSGGTAPYTYAWTARSANPTGVTLSSATAASPTFTTGTFAEVLAGGKVIGLGSPGNPDPAMVYPRAGFVSISTQQLAQMTYNFDCKVTDAVGFSKTVTVAVPPATLSQGNSLVPRNQIAVLSLPGNTTAVTLTAPSGSTATLNEAATANPWFIPDVTGDYSVNGLTVHVGDFVSANPNCGICHNAATRASVDAKFKDWNNSAHGNHFFKYMEYDVGGNLVYKAGVTKLPTANSGVFWNVSDMPAGPMTTFKFGMTGAEGTHYSGSCVGCHTTGYNALAVNGGFDDAAAAATPPWTFPNLANVFGNTLVGAATGDPVTPKPDLTAYNAIPASVVKYQGMQCESCHGPLGQHVVSALTAHAPQPEFDVAVCAVCHDRPSNHDRVALWRQSGHANLELAVGEGSGTSGNPSTSCNRCHSAQGFVQYVDQILGNLTGIGGAALPAYAGNIIDPTLSTPTSFVNAGAAFMIGLGITPQTVQPQTCQACHDPHTTGLRISGNTPMLPAGFQVNGAGAGALCFTCHNSRNGARGDQFNGVYYNNPLPGTTPTPVTSIGGPHEANQGDVLAGQNAFWVPVSPSNHMAVADVCVGCHMKYFPAGLTGTNTNHTWKTDTTICVNCHGSNVNGEALQGQFDLAADALRTAIFNTGSAPLAGAYWMKGSTSGQIAAVAAGQTTSVVLVTGRSVGFTVTLSVDVPNPNAATGTITAGTPIVVGLGGFYSNAGATTRIFDQLNGRIAKANWNYSLATQDGSRSIHNPTFIFDVLSASQAKVVDGSLPL